MINSDFKINDQKNNPIENEARRAILSNADDIIADGLENELDNNAIIKKLENLNKSIVTGPNRLKAIKHIDSLREQKKEKTTEPKQKEEVTSEAKKEATANATVNATALPLENENENKNEVKEDIKEEVKKEITKEEKEASLKKRFIGSKEMFHYTSIEESQGRKMKMQPDRERAADRLYFRSINNQESMNDWVNSKLGVYKHGISTMNQVIALNGFLKQKFPNSNMEAYAIKGLAEIEGIKALGFALGGTIYIDENRWDQDDIYMHEFSHLYYAVTKNEDFTKQIINEALNNKANVQKIKEKYADELIGKAKEDVPSMNLKKDDLIRFSHVLNAQAVGKISEEDIQNLFQILPDHKQDVLIEELFAEYLQGPLSKDYNKYFQPKNEVLRKIKSKNGGGQLKKK